MRDIGTDGLIRYQDSGPQPRPIPGLPQTIMELLALRAVSHADAPAVVDRYRRLSYAQLADEAERGAHALWALGVRPGDVVAASLPNRVELVVAFFGAQRIGAQWCGINPVYTTEERVALLADCEAVVFLGTDPTAGGVIDRRAELPRLLEVLKVDEWIERLVAADGNGDPLLPPLPDDPWRRAGVAYTSGTTGRPKGVVHADRGLLLAAAAAVHGTGNWRLDGTTTAEVVGVCLPLTILNLIVLGPLAALVCGGSCVCIDRGDALGIAEMIEREGVQRISCAPATGYDFVYDDAITPAMLRTLGLGLGGASTPESLRDAYFRKHGRQFTTGYGLTEAPTILTREFDTEVAARTAGSSGRAHPQVEIHIVSDDGTRLPDGEVGEICAIPIQEGPFADVYRPMLGYWRRPEATVTAIRTDPATGAVRLHTGDVGFIDEQGLLHITDRKSELIIRGGANIYPQEVERVLLEHDAVGDCAVVGRPHERLGQEVVAFVQYKPGRRATVPELTEFAAQRLAKYKVPVAITFVESFPRNAMGKIAKRELPLPPANG